MPKENMMTTEQMKQWASGGFYRSFRRNKQWALVEAQQKAALFQLHERSSLALRFEVVADRALEMGGWFAGGKTWLWLIAGCISYLILSIPDRIWWVAPLVIVFLLSLRDRWVCRSRAEAYNSLAAVLDNRYGTPSAYHQWSQPCIAASPEKQISKEAMRLE